MKPRTRYAKSGDVHVAYQVFGDGKLNLLYVPGFVSHVESCWEEPSFAHWLTRIGSFARVAIFDKRGTGLSDRVEALPTLEQRMDDARAVMDAVGFDQAAILGISEGGSLAAMFAGSFPERCSSLVLVGAWSRFEQPFSTPDALAAFVRYVETSWGTGNNLGRFAPSRRKDQAFKEWWGRIERSGASPSAALKLQRMNSEISITAILPAIRVPTLVIHRTNDAIVPVKAGRELARLIPSAKLVELPGEDHLPFVGDNVDEVIDLIAEFMTGSVPPALTDRVLATIFFTDIVSSTEQARALGDKRWQDLLQSHDAIVRHELGHFRGKEVKSLGDGFLATFDGPARAIRCALAIQDGVRPLGLSMRTGLHTGEVELRQGDVRGIAVHLASRIAALANPGELLVSRTVKDLVAGSDIRFEDRGAHTLKGFEEDWQLYRVTRPAG